MARKIPIRTRRNRLPREARTRVLFDETDTDNGQFFRCWNCGFICHDKRDSLGGSHSGDAVEHSDFTLKSPGIIPGTAGSNISVLVNTQRTAASVKNGSDGTSKTVVHSHRTTGAACPQCHSLNWRGDYP